MKPINFKETNGRLGAPHEMKNCGPLPVFTDDKQCVSCWELSVWERIKVLFLGKVWLGVYSGKTQPPVWLKCDRTVFELKITDWPGSDED